MKPSVSRTVKGNCIHFPRVEILEPDPVKGEGRGVGDVVVLVLLLLLFPVGGKPRLNVPLMFAKTPPTGVHNLFAKAASPASRWLICWKGVLFSYSGVTYW